MKDIFVKYQKVHASETVSSASKSQIYPDVQQTQDTKQELKKTQILRVLVQMQSRVTHVYLMTKTYGGGCR